MKATILTSVFAVLVSVSSMNARNVITYSNVECNEAGSKKEYVSLDKETSKPLNKEYYHYDKNGNILEKTTSMWKDGIGWVDNGKYLYYYGDNNKVAYIAYTKWNNDTSSWSNKSDVVAHIYDENNTFLSVMQFQVDNNVTDYQLLSEK